MTANLQKKTYSERSTYYFKKVERHGIPALLEAVKAGLAVSTAAIISDRSEEEQARLLALERRELIEELRKKPREVAPGGTLLPNLGKVNEPIEAALEYVRRVVEITGWAEYIPESWINYVSDELQNEGFQVKKQATKEAE